MRVDLTGKSWLDLAREVLCWEKAAEPHAHLSAERVSDAMPHVVLDSHLSVGGTQQSTDAQADHRQAPREPAGVPLRVRIVHDHASRLLLLDVVCDPGQVHPSISTRATGYYEQALANLVAAPAAVAARADLRSAGDRENLTKWCVGPLPQGTAFTDVYTLFREQMNRQPHATAVCDTDESVSYAELDRRILTVAHRLRAVGVDRGHRVGVHVHRSVDLVVGLLAAMAIGAAYVPLDPDFPSARLEFIARDADLRCIIAEPAAKPLEVQAPTVFLADGRPAAVPTGTALRQGDIASQDAAYVIYTSGSTGHPKGTVVGHGNLLNFFLAMDHAIGLSPDDRVLALTSVSFDISVLEILWPLVRGACTVICPERMIERLAHGNNSLTDLVGRFRPSLLQATPSFLTAVAAQPAALEALRGLETLLVGGEALTIGLAGDLVDALPGVRILNMYGPTETTIWSLANQLDHDGAPVSPPPIGRPLAHTVVRVVDGLGNDACVGVAGELWIGGRGVAQGYFRRPELDRERFVRHADSSAGRYYLSGDRVRWREDGTLDFLGRNDRQVKVRGHRIELDEIEGVLSEHPQVEAAAVVMSQHHERGDELVAYVCARPGQHAPSSTEQATSSGVPSGMMHPDALRTELRRFARERLLEVMVPTRMVLLDRLPTAERQSRPRRVEHRGRWGGTAGRPGRSTPARDAGRGRRLRPVGGIAGPQAGGPDVDFFNLGGTSLIAVRMAARWVAESGVPFDLEQFFQRPTVRHLVRLTGGDSSDARGVDGARVSAEQSRPAAFAALPPGIRPTGLREPAGPPYRNILVTEGASTAGVFLVRALLDQSDAAVHVLARPADHSRTMQHLRARMQRFELWRPGDGERIRTVTGDPALPNLGLEAPLYHQLSRTIDVIIHEGECFDHKASFEQLVPVNILGTQEVLRFAATEVVKPVHFLSLRALGRSEAPAGDSEPPGSPEDLARSAASLVGGLQQSKWLGESYMREAAARGIPTLTYRIGQVVAVQRQTMELGDDFLAALVKTCLLLRTAPDLDLLLPVTPADLLAEVVVHTALSGQWQDEVCDVVTGPPVTWREMVSDIRSTGRSVDVVPYRQWRRALLETLEKGEANDLTPFLAVWRRSCHRSSDTSQPGTLPPGRSSRPTGPDRTSRTPIVKGAEICCARTRRASKAW
ncbi:amino acid adenylation domain-containing protein [Streptacidiphilus sp. 4-A2]|nr:amino acid adenylation domain-containing protein [Streptacidiphilus sp. 4-A2]